jgi:hypothetical protein
MSDKQMITTRRAPRTQRVLIAAFALSILVHFFGGALWAHTTHLISRVMQRLPEQHAREQEVATSDTIHLERRAVPRPATRSRTQPTPRHVSQRERPPAAVSKAASQQAAQRPPVSHAKPTPSAAPEIAHEVHRAPRHRVLTGVAKTAGSGKPSVPGPKGALSAAQLAKLNARFAQTIAASHVDLATIQKQIAARPAATKRYPLQFTGMQANLERGEGYIEPITLGERIGPTVWYYTHYTYMWPDGHLEEDDIPWPFRYPVQRDLFALHIHLIPLQLPPPGFHLTRPLKPFLARFLQRAGQG